MEYNYGKHSSIIRSKDGRDKSVSFVHEPLKEEETTNAYRRCKAEFSGACAVTVFVEDDIINLIGVQDIRGSADMKNVFGMVSNLIG